MKSISTILSVALLTLTVSSCAIINPGEVGVKIKQGKLDDKVYTSGRVNIMGMNTRLIRIPTRTVNREVKLNLPSKEGLNVNAEISILYHIEAEKAPEIIEKIGTGYEEIMILSVFRSASADICAQFYAKDMHSGKRNEIEQAIQEKMASHLEDRGFTIEAVLLKSISLPEGLYTAIEDKLEAEQEAQRMEFVLQKETMEAERKKIEAQGTADAQLILSDGLNARTIEWKSLEVLNNLAASPNAKLIITDGKTPIMVDAEPDK